MSDAHGVPITFDTLAVRALNTCRIVHLPTYAGLRLLLGGAANDPAAMLSFICQRTRVRDGWRYFGFQVLKDAPHGRKPEYRNCIVGSPITLLAESHVLSLMAGEPSFKPPACAFSYLWPASANDGRNFAYFFEGYQKRTGRVNELLGSHPDLVAVVADIKKFYPSVSKPRLSDLVGRRIEAVSDAGAARTIRAFVDGLLNQSGAKVSGLPIGPDLSHLLGHVALDEVDRAMEAEYGEHYLRYVDDFVVVCSRSEVRAVTDKLKALLGHEGLSLNDDKQDVVEPRAWREEGLHSLPNAGSEGFSGLLRTISAYLLKDSGKAKELHEALRSEGFALPIARLAGQTRSRRYRSVMARAIRTGKWLFSWINGSVDTPESIIRKARETRDELLDVAETLDRCPPHSPMRRKWFAQRRRSIYNRLLYLLPKSDYQRLLDMIPDLDEFHDVRVVASAILSGTATGVLPFPGRITATFCQLWPEHHAANLPSVHWPIEAGRAEGEAAAHLALRLSVTPPESVLAKITEHSPGARILIDLCSRSKADQRAISALTYLDEMENLFRDVPHNSIQELLQYRFDEDEESGLEGLSLGGGDYFTPWYTPDYDN